jgi:hypothetical protein
MLPVQIIPSLHFKIFYSAVQYFVIVGLGLIFRENDHTLIRTAIAAQIISLISCYLCLLCYGSYVGFYFAESPGAESSDNSEPHPVKDNAATTVILAWILIVSIGTLLVLLDAIFMCRSHSQMICHGFQGDMESLYASSVIAGMQVQIFVSALVSYVRFSSDLLKDRTLTQQIIIFGLFVQSLPYYVLRSKNISDGCKTGSIYRFAFVVSLCVADMAISFFQVMYSDSKISISRHFVLMWFAIIGGSQLFRFCDSSQSNFNLSCGAVIGVLASISMSDSQTKKKTL